ncbi:hypothetical protein X975_06208, partial [Stegodyphus mimosarum]
MTTHHYHRKNILYMVVSEALQHLGKRFCLHPSCFVHLCSLLRKVPCGIMFSDVVHNTEAFGNPRHHSVLVPSAFHRWRQDTKQS